MMGYMRERWREPFETVAAPDTYPSVDWAGGGTGVRSAIPGVGDLVYARDGVSVLTDTGGGKTASVVATLEECKTLLLLNAWEAFEFCRVKFRGSLPREVGLANLRSKWNKRIWR